MNVQEKLEQVCRRVIDYAASEYKIPGSFKVLNQSAFYEITLSLYHQQKPHVLWHTFNLGYDLRISPQMQFSDFERELHDDVNEFADDYLKLKVNKLLLLCTNQNT